MTHKRKTALIIGASRGLGLAMCQEYLKRGWSVIGTVRDLNTQLHQVAKAQSQDLEIELLDVNEPSQIEALRGRLEGRTIDLLFINAGVSNGHEATVGEVATDEFIRIMVTNALSPLRILEALEHLVAPTGTIGVMSSGLGSVTNNTGGGWEVYRASKAALNTLMRSFGARHSESTRPMIVVAPGWIRTDMGGPSATYSVEESIPVIVDMLMAQSGKPGLRFLDRNGVEVAW